ncbi:hypothetical protein BB561_005642 [Smittium simulii]|uniref:Piwi domain-containing protein n=1 Tax=Smittium simulii TaxID=133385 RepID=A0A2T9Y9B1_9FUNG|nr:hypothetical protein BB561_005642 [Smittium simulii]
MDSDTIKPAPPQVELAKRAGFGKAGRRVQIITNFYEVQTFFNQIAYQYDIDITLKPREATDDKPARPFVDKKFPPKLCRQVFESFTTQHSAKSLDRIPLAYDGSRVAYTTKRLPLKEHEQTFEVSFAEGGGPKFRIFIIKIKEAAQIDMSTLNKYIAGDCADENMSLCALRVLDTVLYQDLVKTHVKVGRSFFNSADKRSLGEGIDLWRGIFQSVKAGMGKLYVNTDVANTAFLIEAPVVDFACAVLQLRDPSELNSQCTPEMMNQINRLLKGATLSMNHRGQGNNKFKSKGLSDRGADKINFKIIDPKTNVEKDVTVAAYLQQRYNVRLRFPYLPCIEFGKENYLPMELCSLAPGQHYKKKLNEQQTAEMIKHACQKPKQRQEMIQRNFDDSGYDNSVFMKNFNFKISNRMSRIEARQLPPPEVLYNKASRESKLCPRDGAWNMRDKVVWKGTSLTSWGVVVLMDQRRASQQTVQNFLRTLITTCKNTGLDIVNQRPNIIYANSMGNISQQLSSAFKEVGNTNKMFPQLLLCILPNTSPVLYGKIKKTAYTELGVHTQCMIGKHITKPNPQYCANLCLKMNVKLGGISSTLTTSSLPKISSVPTIVFGADVTHPGVGESERPSIAAVVASMDPAFTRYKAVLAQQHTRLEIIQNLTGIVRDQLIAFYKSTNCKPARIVFYRDGVSDGQFAEVMSSEVQAISDACELLEKGYSPKITFIIVQKRHRAKFFPTDQGSSDRSGNCAPGTVVDTTIVSPAVYDFYLQSHSGIQGTSKSTHYIVLKDQNGFTPDELQSLTYNMCYLYAICTRSVSIVPCVYYAHRVAFRARSHTKDVWGSMDTGSVYSDNQTSAENVPIFDSKLLPVHDKLKQSMYFM